MATTEVTQAQWKALMGSNPSNFRGNELPLERVSWDDAKEFIRRLNENEGTTRYHLPTEAEWEYACRAESPMDRHGHMSASGWFDPNSGNKAHPVRQKQPNAWGLYDMLGNVYEWCEDWKDEYPSGNVTNPRGPSSGLSRVARGGSWFVHANRSRAFFRDGFNPEHRCHDGGFRVTATLQHP